MDSLVCHVMVPLDDMLVVRENLAYTPTGMFARYTWLVESPRRKLSEGYTVTFAQDSAALRVSPAAGQSRSHPYTPVAVRRSTNTGSRSIFALCACNSSVLVHIINSPRNTGKEYVRY